jgi:methylmalonyl-CoA/ethylmalonyl-CoA epimerase
VLLIDGTFAMSPLADQPSGRRLHHIGLVVPKVQEAAESFDKWLGPIETTMPFEDEAQKVRVQFVHAGGGTFIELIEPATTGSPVDQFLRDRGGGLHHIAFEVPDFDLALQEVERNGARLVGRPWIGFEGRRLAFVMPRSGLRLLVELVQRRVAP